ncbi:MAG TPA: hypothetical protein VHN82_02330 [Methanoregula sp.]|nr:hypothetical protein [Methanoregula sp.]
MAGEDQDQVLRDLFFWNGNLVAEGCSGFGNPRFPCSAHACYRCTDTRCSYAVVIRRYRDLPRCD